MSFFHRNNKKSSGETTAHRYSEDDIATADSSAAWYHTNSSTATAPPFSSSINNEFHFSTTDDVIDGRSPTTSTTTTATGFLHPESSSKIFSSNWALERSSQQTDLENEVLTHNNAKRGVQVVERGCCQSTLIVLIKGLHIFNVTLGIALVVYGILVQQHGQQHSQEVPEQQPDQLQQSEDEQVPQQAMAAVLFCILLGSLHLLTSGVGLFSLFYHNNIIKCGFVTSAWAGPYFSVLYLSIIIALIFDSDGFIMYLQEHAQAMYLGSDAVVESAATIFLPVAYSLLGVLGILESMRYCILMNIYNELVAREELGAYIPGSSSSTSSSKTSLTRSSRRSGTRNKVSANDTLTQALLQDSIDAEETVRSNNSVDPNWWEN
jgi:hypothetical protein